MGKLDSASSPLIYSPAALGAAERTWLEFEEPCVLTLRLGDALS